LEKTIFETIAENHPTFTSHKAKGFSKGVVKVARSLARVINFQIIGHGFQRIGVYPLDAAKCLANCDKTTLSQYEQSTIDHILTQIPGLSETFLKTNGGQITEAEMDKVGIPKVSSDDRRLMPKDERTQSHQRAVLINHSASVSRRKIWLEQQEQKGLHAAAKKQSNSSGEKRKRAPNRPKEIIDEEKRLKAARKEARDQNAVANKI
jgi:hypothetical protein